MSGTGILLTALALLALLVARAGVSASARSGGAAEHLRRLFTLLALLLALRIAWQGWASPLVVALVMVVASWLPLAVLRLGEELVRRHALRPLKLAALGGAVGFSILAATFGLVWTREAVLALAAFQIVIVVGVVVHLVRHRGSVSHAERAAADLIALALAIALPLVATDFQRLFPELAVRGGAFAALVVVLAASRLVTRAARPLGLLADIAVAMGGGAIGALAAQLAGAGEAVLPLVAAPAAALAALALLLERFTGLARAPQRVVERVAAAGPTAEAMLAAHPLLAGGQAFGAEAFADLPDGSLAALVASAVTTRERATGDVLHGAAGELLDRFGSTHILRLSAHPPRFLAIGGDPLAGEALDGELAIVARLLETAE